MPGQCGDRKNYVAEFGSEWTDGFEGIRLEGAQTHPRTELQIHL